MASMRKIDEKNMFAVWRFDAPWKPIVKRGAVKYASDICKSSKSRFSCLFKAVSIIFECHLLDEIK